MNLVRSSRRASPALGLDDLPGLPVRGADVANLALAHELVQRGQRLLDRRDRIGEVELVQVDPVGLEPPERCLDGDTDVAAGAARSPIRAVLAVHVAAELGREHDLLAAALERVADEGFAVPAAAVDVGGVDQRDPGIDRRLDDLACLRPVAAGAEVVRPEPDDRDHQAGGTERAVAH